MRYINQAVKLHTQHNTTQRTVMVNHNINPILTAVLLTFLSLCVSAGRIGRFRRTVDGKRFHERSSPQNSDAGEEQLWGDYDFETQEVLDQIPAGERVEPLNADIPVYDGMAVYRGSKM